MSPKLELVGIAEEGKQMLSRRLFLTELSASAVFAPAIVRSGSLMPVRPFAPVFAEAQAYDFVQRLYIHSNLTLIKPLIGTNLSLVEIAAALNRRSFKTVSESDWTAKTVESVITVSRSLELLSRNR